MYTDQAVVELLSTKYADKTEEAVSRDRAKTMQDLNRCPEGLYKTGCFSDHINLMNTSRQQKVMNLNSSSAGTKFNGSFAITGNA